MSNNIELEIKIKMEENDFYKLKNHFQKILDENITISHSDLYFLPMKHSLGYLKTVNNPYKWLRIRTTNDSLFELTFKHHFPEGEKKHLFCHEYETNISNRDTMILILNSIGYKEEIEVNKKRMSFNYDNEMEISFDIVEKLGFFVEFEMKKIIDGNEKTKAKLIKFIKNLNINYEIINYGYPYLIHKKTVGNKKYS